MFCNLLRGEKYKKFISGVTFFVFLHLTYIEKQTRKTNEKDNVVTRKETRHTEFEQMLRRSRRILYKVCLAFTDRQHTVRLLMRSDIFGE